MPIKRKEDGTFSIGRGDIWLHIRKRQFKDKTQKLCITISKTDIGTGVKKEWQNVGTLYLDKTDVAALIHELNTIMKKNLVFYSYCNRCLHQNICQFFKEFLKIDITLTELTSEIKKQRETKVEDNVNFYGLICLSQPCPYFREKIREEKRRTMKCKHIGVCKQKVSKEIFELYCLKGKVGGLQWRQDDCFKYGDMSFVKQSGELRLPKEWEEAKQ